MKAVGRAVAHLIPAVSSGRTFSQNCASHGFHYLSNILEYFPGSSKLKSSENVENKHIAESHLECFAPWFMNGEWITQSLFVNDLASDEIGLDQEINEV